MNTGVSEKLFSFFIMGLHDTFLHYTGEGGECECESSRITAIWHILGEKEMDFNM